MKITIPNDDKIISLDLVRESGRKIREIRGNCDHSQVTADITLESLICNKCNERVSPMAWIVSFFENYERNMQTLIDQERRAKAALATFELRSKIKCHHCGKFSSVRVGKDGF